MGCLHKRSADVSLPLTVLDTFRPREVLKRATPPPGHNGCPHLCGYDEAGAHRAPPVRKHISGEGRATLHSRCPQIPPGVYLCLSQSLSGRALPLTPAQHHSPQTADAWSSAVESILVNVCRSRSPQFAGVCELCDEGPACTRIRRWPAARQLIGQPGCSRTTADVLLGPFRRCAGHGGPSSADRRLAEPVHLTPHMRLLPRAHSWETTSSNPVDPGSDG